MCWKNLSMCALVTMWALPVWATPSQMNVDGVLRDTGGNLVTADIDITFSLHGQTDGSDELWTETQAVSVKNGVFSSRIPSDPANSPFPDGIFGGDSAYLQIQSAGQDALPMISLASVPYAMHAKASVSADTALALDCEACIETPMLSASVTIAASQVTYDDAANGLGATVQNALDGLFAQITGLTFADLVGGSDAVIAVIAGDGFARLSDLAIVASTGQFGDLQGIPAGLSDGDDDTQLSSADVLGMVSDGGYVTGEHSHNFALPHDHPYLTTAGGTLSGSLAMSSNKVTGLAAPTADADAATKAYVDAASGGGGFSIKHVECSSKTDADGDPNPAPATCVAPCPSGMRVMYAHVTCTFQFVGNFYMGEGGGYSSKSPGFHYGCAKLPQATDTSVTFRATTNTGNMEVFGSLFCITAS
jgi:hypothetical protein